MKEKYLIDIKNAMFWHFSSSEIKDTLEELDEHFESAHNNGVSDDKIIKEYGKPVMIARELRNDINPIEWSRKKSVVLKSIMLLTCVIFVFISMFLLPLDIASYITVVLGSVFIWFLAGNNCIVKILETTKEKKHAFIKAQAGVITLFLFLQICSLIIIPSLAKTDYAKYIGKNINIFINFIIIVLFFMTIFLLKKMLEGNIHMFLVVIQNISIISGLFLYNDFLKNIETLNRMKFVFTPYFICLPVLLFYWLYIYKKRERNECTN